MQSATPPESNVPSNLEALKAYGPTILTALSLPPFKDGAT
jgi:hypothetical protein